MFMSMIIITYCYITTSRHVDKFQLFYTYFKITAKYTPEKQQHISIFWGKLVFGCIIIKKKSYAVWRDILKNSIVKYKDIIKRKCLDFIS